MCAGAHEEKPSDQAAFAEAISYNTHVTSYEALNSPLSVISFQRTPLFKETTYCFLSGIFESEQQPLGGDACTEAHAVSPKQSS